MSNCSSSSRLERTEDAAAARGTPRWARRAGCRRAPPRRHPSFVSSSATPVDRRVVDDARGQHRRVVRVVEEVDPLGGEVDLVGPDRDHEVVRPQHPARVGDREPHVGVVERDLRDVAGPRERGGEVAGAEVADVVVAVEPVDLPVVHRLLERVERGLRGVVRRLRRVGARVEHEQPDGVAHLREHGLGSRHGEEVVDRPDLLAGQLDVVGDPGHAGRPRRGVLARRVERRRSAGSGSRFALFGNFASSKGCTQGGSTWLIRRLAIQSVRTMPSRPGALALARGWAGSS